MTNPLTRHPAITASAIATVDEISGGRAILGIGAGDRPLIALGLKPSTLANLEASISAVRELWSGAGVNVAGGSLRCTTPTCASRPALAFPSSSPPAGHGRWSWPVERPTV